MIVRNEAARLPVCLESLRGLDAEVIVVDTGSDDETIAVASAHGAHVVSFPWVGDFSQARNYGFNHATGAWILVLDADESLSPQSVVALQAIVAGEPDAAYSLIQRSPDAAGGCISSPTVRLVPNRADVRYLNPVHEELLSSLTHAGISIREVPIVIDHAGYRSPDELQSKIARNAAILETAIAAGADADPQMVYNLGNSLLDRNDLVGAIRELSRCVEMADDTRPRLAAAARLKAAQAMVRAGQLEEARTLLPNQPDTSLHPLSLALRAQIEESLGAPGEARRWHEATLAAEDVAYVPHVTLAPMKLKALMFLGDFWARAGRNDIGAGVLKLALAIHQQPEADIGSNVLLRYADLFPET